MSWQISQQSMGQLKPTRSFPPGLTQFYHFACGQDNIILRTNKIYYLTLYCEGNRLQIQRGPSSVNKFITVVYFSVCDQCYWRHSYLIFINSSFGCQGQKINPVNIKSRFWKQSVGLGHCRITLCCWNALKFRNRCIICDNRKHGIKVTGCDTVLVSQLIKERF